MSLEEHIPADSGAPISVASLATAAPARPERHFDAARDLAQADWDELRTRLGVAMQADDITGDTITLAANFCRLRPSWNPPFDEFDRRRAEGLVKLARQHGDWRGMAEIAASSLVAFGSSCLTDEDRISLRQSLEGYGTVNDFLGARFASNLCALGVVRDVPTDPGNLAAALAEFRAAGDWSGFAKFASSMRALGVPVSIEEGDWAGMRGYLADVRNGGESWEWYEFAELAVNMEKLAAPPEGGHLAPATPPQPPVRKF